MTKNELIKGITLADIYDFVDNGDPGNAPEKIIVYLDFMDKVRSMDLHSLELVIILPVEQVAQIQLNLMIQVIMLFHHCYLAQLLN